MLEKPKLSFDTDSITIKAKIELPRKETEKYPRNVFTSLLSGWSFKDWWLGIPSAIRQKGQFQNGVFQENKAR